MLHTRTLASSREGTDVTKLLIQSMMTGPPMTTLVCRALVGGVG